MDNATIIKELYGGIAKDLNEVVAVLTMSPETNKTMWDMIHSIYTMLLPIGLMIAATFALMTILEKAILFKTHNMESVVKLLLLFVLGKVIVENSWEILGWLYQVVAEMITQVGGGIEPNEIGIDLDSLTAALDGMNMLQRAMTRVSLMPNMAIMGLMKVIIKVIAYGRLIEIYIYTAVAPLPLSTLVSETHAGIAKRFLQGYLGVCIQGLIMLISIKLYIALDLESRITVDVTSMTSGSLGFIVPTLVLLLVLVRSGSWAKTIVGLL